MDLTVLAIFTPVFNVWLTYDCKAEPGPLLSWNIKHVVGMCSTLACREVTRSQRCPGCVSEHHCCVKQSLTEDDGCEMMRTGTLGEVEERGATENPALADPAAVQQVTLLKLGLFQPSNT